MSRDLFDESPDPTPTPEPAPSTSPALSGHGHDDDGDGDDTTKKKAKLSPLQQKFLADQRLDLHARAKAERKLVMAYRRNRREARKGIAPILPRLINKTHLGSWDDVWLLVEGLYLLMVEHPYAFALSGWCASNEDFSGPPVPPSRRLLDMAYRFGIYGRASALAAASMASVTDENAEWLWGWVRCFPTLFEAAVVDGEWTAERIKQVADDEMARRTVDLQAEFLFLEKRVFWFTPSATEPGSGWNDFFYLTLGYHYLPDDLKKDLGPYALTIRTLPSHSPAPPNAPAVTVPTPPPGPASPR